MKNTIADRLNSMKREVQTSGAVADETATSQVAPATGTLSAQEPAAANVSPPKSADGSTENGSAELVASATSQVAPKASTPVVEAPTPVIAAVIEEEQAAPPATLAQTAKRRREELSVASATSQVRVPHRNQGIMIHAPDEQELAEIQEYCLNLGIKLHGTTNLSLLSRVGWRLLHDVMKTDPEAFLEAIAQGRPVVRPATSQVRLNSSKL